MPTITKKIPDDIFKIIFDFVGVCETCAWTAQAVQTNNSIAPWLLRFCHDTKDQRISPVDRFWANEYMLHIVQTQCIKHSFQSIRFEDAVCLYTHDWTYINNNKQTKNQILFRIELRRILAALDIDNLNVDSFNLCHHVCCTFFGECDLKSRTFIQRRFFDVCAFRHCVVDTMFLLNKKQTLGFFGVEKKINLFFLKVFKKKTSRHIFFVNVSKKICFFRYIT